MNRIKCPKKPLGLSQPSKQIKKTSIKVFNVATVSCTTTVTIIYLDIPNPSYPIAGRSLGTESWFTESTKIQQQATKLAKIAQGPVKAFQLFTFLLHMLNK